MQYSYSYYSDNEEGLLAMILFYAVYGLFAGGFSIALYVFRSLGVYTIAKRRGLKHSWFAWVPVVDHYLLGSLSDQYQYVVKGKNKSKRKWLLGLSIAIAVMYVALMVMLIGLAVTFAGNAAAGFSQPKLEKMALRSLLSVMAAAVPLAVLGIANAVLRYIALYDVYTSVDPRNNVLYIVLSVLFKVSEPFFLFFNRKRDDGMPPRREPQPAAWVEPQPQPEGPWDME